MAEEIIQTLGFDAGNALNTLNQLNTILGNVSQGLKACADGARDFNSASKTTSKRFSAIADAAGKAEKAVAGYATAAAANAQVPMPVIPSNIQGLVTVLAQVQQNLAGVATSAQAAQQALSNASSVSVAALNKTKKASDKLSVSFGTMVRVVTTQLIVRAMSTLRNAMEESLSTAIEFETRLAEIQTIGGPLAGSIDELATKMRRVSEEFNKPIEDVAAGYYDILSNQIGNAAESQTVLIESARLATAAVSSLKDAANALASVINSYSLSAADAADISGKLFTAIELGRFRLSDIANTLGRVTTLASAMGVSIDEVLASLATLTINGVKADEAMTLLSNSMRGLLKPTKAMKKAFAELGVDNAEAGVATYGFQGFLEQLRETTHGTASEIAQLTENIRVGRGVFGLTGAAAEKYAQNLERIRESGGAKSLEKAQLILETNAQRVQKEMTKLRNFFVQDFGMEAIKVIKQLFDTFGGLVNIVKAVRDALLFWGKTLILIKAAVIAIAACNAALTANASLWYAAGVAARLAVAAMMTIPGAIVITALSAAWLAYTRNAEDAAAATKKASQTIREDLENAYNALEQKIEAQTRVQLVEAKKVKAERTKQIELAYSQQLRLVAELNKLYKKDTENATAAQEEIFDALTGQLKERLSLIKKLINELEQRQKKSARTIQKNQDEVASLRLKNEERYVDRQIGRVKDQEKAEIQLRRSRVLSSRASKAAYADDFKAAEELYKTSDQRAVAALELAEAQLKEAKTTGEQQKALAAIRNAEQQVNDILAQRIKLREEENRQAKAQAEAAKKEQAARQAQLRDAKSLIKQISKYEVIAKDVSESFATREDAKKAIEPLLDELKSVLSRRDVNLEEFLGIERLARDIRGQFQDAITGRPVDLKQAYGRAIDEVFNEWQKRTLAFKAEIASLELSTGAKFDLAEGLKPISLALIEQRKQLLEAVEQLSNVPQMLGDIEKQYAKAAQILDDLGGTRGIVEEPDKRILREAVAQAKRYKKTGEAGQLLDYIGELNRLSDQYFARANEAASSLATKIAEGEDTDALKALPEEYRTVGLQFAQLASTLNALAETNARMIATTASETAVTEKIAEAVQTGRLADSQRMILTFQEAQRNTIKQQGELITVVRKLGPAGITASDTVAAEFEVKLIPAIDKATKKAAKLKETLGSLSTTGGLVTPVTTQATGGLIKKLQHYASGGLARGTDTIPAMLSDHEFVVTAKNARKFMPELQAINAGIEPSFQPSSVTNTTTVGDIIVNGAGQPQVVAREVMAQIRRERRRGTGRL
jgi:TP901 family phage tail tape measure protein